jgi:hypothetical protein
VGIKTLLHLNLKKSHSLDILENGYHTLPGYFGERLSHSYELLYHTEPITQQQNKLILLSAFCMNIDRRELYTGYCTEDRDVLVDAGFAPALLDMPSGI